MNEMPEHTVNEQHAYSWPYSTKTSRRREKQTTPSCYAIRCHRIKNFCEWIKHKFVCNVSYKLTVRITWQGEPVGDVLVEWIGLVESELCKDHHMDSGEDYHKELFTIDSANIIHEYIEKGDPEFRNVTQMRFEIMDGFFRYEAEIAQEVW